MNTVLVIFAFFICLATCQTQTVSPCNVCPGAAQVNCTEPNTFCCALCGDVGDCRSVGTPCPVDLTRCFAPPNCGGTIRPPPTCNACPGAKQVNCTDPTLECCAPCGDTGTCVPKGTCIAAQCLLAAQCGQIDPPTQLCNTCNNSKLPPCPSGSKCCQGCEAGPGFCGTECPLVKCAFTTNLCDDGGILPPQPPPPTCNCSGLPKPPCLLNRTLITHNCVPYQTYTTDSITTTLKTAPSCKWVPVCGDKICTKSLTCGDCVETVISAATLGSLTTEAAAIKACVTSSTPSLLEKLCQPIRACGYVNGVCGRNPLSETKYQSCLQKTPPPPPVCKGFSNPCTCSYDNSECQYVSGTISLPAIGTDPARDVKIGQCVPVEFAGKVTEALAPATTVSGAYAAAQTAASTDAASATASAGTTYTASISPPITERPPVCATGSGVVSSEEKEAETSPDPTVGKIFKNGLDADTITSNLAKKINEEAGLSGIVPRILAFTLPQIGANGDVSISSIIEIATGSLTSTQQSLLCEKFKTCVADSISKTASDFKGCKVTPMSSSTKRSVEQTPTNFVVETSYTQSSASAGSLLTVSLGLVALFAVVLTAY